MIRSPGHSLYPGDCSNFMSIDLSCNFKINFKIKLFVSFMPVLHDSAVQISQGTNIILLILKQQTQHLALLSQYSLYSHNTSDTSLYSHNTSIFSYNTSLSSLSQHLTNLLQYLTILLQHTSTRIGQVCKPLQNYYDN